MISHNDPAGQRSTLSVGLLLAGLVAHEPAAAGIPRDDTATSVALNHNPAATTDDHDLLSPAVDVDVAAAVAVTAPSRAARRQGITLLRDVHRTFYRRLLTDLAPHIDPADHPDPNPAADTVGIEFLTLASGLTFSDAWRRARRVGGAYIGTLAPLLLSYTGGDRDHPWRLNAWQLRWRLRRFSRRASSEAAVRLTEQAAAHRAPLHHTQPHRRPLKAQLELAEHGGPQQPAHAQRHKPQFLSEELSAATRQLLYDVDRSPDPTSPAGEWHLLDSPYLRSAAESQGCKTPSAIASLTEAQARATIGEQSPTRQLFWGRHLTDPCPALDLVAETYENLGPAKVATLMGLHEARKLSRTLRHHYGCAVTDLDSHADTRRWQHPTRVGQDLTDWWPWMTVRDQEGRAPVVDLNQPVGTLQWRGSNYGRLPDRASGILQDSGDWHRLAHLAATTPEMPLVSALAVVAGDSPAGRG